MNAFHDAHGFMILALRNARHSRERTERGDIDGALTDLLQAQRWKTLAELKNPPKVRSAEYCARVQWVVSGIARARAALAVAAKPRD
jgi:hypothetical protein